MKKLNEIADKLFKLTPQEAKELQLILEEDYGIKAPDVFSTPAQPKTEKVEQTEFDVVLTAVPTSKIAVVKLIKELSNIGLIESKKKMDDLPSILFEKVDKEEAESLAQQFRSLDCNIELN